MTNGFVTVDCTAVQSIVLADADFTCIKSRMMCFQISKVNSDLKPNSLQLRVEANFTFVDNNGYFPRVQNKNQALLYLHRVNGSSKVKSS